MALQSARQLLDELMGRERNLRPTEKTSDAKDWNDPRICRYFLVCFCPNQLFTNTKADMGPCHKIHDNYIKQSYEESAPKKQKSAFEREFIKFCQQTLGDVERRIKRAKQRLAASQTEKVENLTIGGDPSSLSEEVKGDSQNEEGKDQLQIMKDRIQKLLCQARVSSVSGEVDEDLATKIAKKKKLSKKKEKKLRKVLDRKAKLKNRKSLLEELKKYQLDSQAYLMLTSSAQMQTKGCKRKLAIDADVKLVESSPEKIKTTGKRKRAKINTFEGGHSSDLNCIGFNKSESESSDEESDVEPETSTPGPDDENEEIAPEETKIVEKSELIPKSKDEPNISNQLDSKMGPKKIEPSQKEKKEKKEDNQPIKQIETKYVPVYRKKEVEEARSKLPIIGEEQTIMETIRYNRVTIICGETGSGKTTQVPQFLYEAGYAQDRKIGITEPRRVAAIAMSRRVGKEMNLSSDVVSYQIRFENNCTEKTKLKFMTDGILFKEVQKDPFLKEYSVIIIDEAHERSVYSDILIGWLSRVILARKDDPLKLIIMSATLRISDFCENTRLFKVQPPVIKISSRQFPVSVHFSKKTSESYLLEAYHKICKIHRKEPTCGGILVFVTGRREVVELCKKLRRSFPFNAESLKLKEEADEQRDINRKENRKAMKKSQSKPKTLDDLMPQIDLDSYNTDLGLGDDGSDVDEHEDHQSDDESEDEKLACSDPLYCLPLYSNLSEKKQQMVFENPPEGCRVCVIATNVAETSLTIPNIKYVVDTGKVKQKVYDQVTGISTFIVDWTSKASADQRAGRAGRLGPGHCYRLYSSSVYSDFKEFSDPDIAQKPVDDLVLQMKVMGIDNVVNFPFPSPPSVESLIASEKRLTLLGALDAVSGNRPSRLRKTKKMVNCRKITKLGKVMAQFPLSPRYSKILTLAAQHDLMDYAIFVVAGLSIQEIFDEQSELPLPENNQSLSFIKRCLAGKGASILLGDVMVILKAIGAWLIDKDPMNFCERHKLRIKALNEIKKLITQLRNEVNTICPSLNLCSTGVIDPPSDEQTKFLRQIVLASHLDKVARLRPNLDTSKETTSKKRNSYQSIEFDSPVYIPKSSVLHNILPEWVVYQEIYQSSQHFMRNIVAIEPEWLPIYARPMCTFSKPLAEPVPQYDPVDDCVKCTVHCTFGPHGWQIPDARIEYPDNLDTVKYRWFARYLLEGKVVENLPCRNLLLYQPKVMLGSYIKLLDHANKILESLFSAKICTKKQLISKWAKEPKYLFNEYCLWIPQAHRFDVEDKWPPQLSSNSHH
ncbi:putative ATP-dependent RNA helicase kurz [Brevipalpus obovatus]|uniref:putative ATP-dependent RNA helicase kurz n=1 Tax=Brevipalpus obovatus TaxID=246614 RepID=UPI003D9E99E9